MINIEVIKDPLNITWWKNMVQGVLTANKVQTFSIHCWSDEIDEINHALLYGSIQDSDWAYGAIISGKITPSFIDFILSYEPAPCSKTGTYEKMTPFFNVVLEPYFFSSHYGREVSISQMDIRKGNIRRTIKTLFDEDWVIIHSF